jgi:2-polyprenyl-6-methoxyphenol hydroxylase-like FAD-dependent oxidoreductase
MRVTEIVIAGGGLAGSAAAAMLGRAGYGVMLVDPHPVYPADFRAEKIDGRQAAILHRTGLAEAVLRAATLDGESWVARFGRLIEKRPGDQHGMLYDTMVNTMRAQIPASVTFARGKVMDIVTSDEWQAVRLADGNEISARLVVVANGLNVGLRDKLGMTREIISKTHSIMLGFDLMPKDRQGFDFPALTYYGEDPADRTAYVTLFPIGGTMRANLCVYREMDDLWLREFRQAPRETFIKLMPGLESIIGGYDVPGIVQVRPADLYVTHGVRQAGVVLVGDAFSTSCPAAGTGTGKVFTDVERLCNVHVPKWFATPGMTADKIMAFYDDPVRAAYHQFSHDKAFHLSALTCDTGVMWSARRWIRFAAGLAAGKRRALTSRFGVGQGKRAMPTDGTRPMRDEGFGRAA